MILGKVIGTVWATRKDEKLEGLSLLIVGALSLEGRLEKSFFVAVDSVGAGVGETVLIAGGSSARQTRATQNKPVDHVIMAIVDSFDVSDPTAPGHQRAAVGAGR